MAFVQMEFASVILDLPVMTAVLLWSVRKVARAKVYVSVASAIANQDILVTTVLRLPSAIQLVAMVNALMDAAIATQATLAHFVLKKFIVQTTAPIKEFANLANVFATQDLSLRTVTSECLVPMVVRDMEFAMRASACAPLDFLDVIVLDLSLVVLTVPMSAMVEVIASLDDAFAMQDSMVKIALKRFRACMIAHTEDFAKADNASAALDSVAQIARSFPTVLKTAPSRVNA